jgi:hypothetical protein
LRNLQIYRYYLSVSSARMLADGYRYLPMLGA